jgi:hypothetical protein
VITISEGRSVGREDEGSSGDLGNRLLRVIRELNSSIYYDFYADDLLTTENPSEDTAEVTTQEGLSGLSLQELKDSLIEVVKELNRTLNCEDVPCEDDPQGTDSNMSKIVQLTKTLNTTLATIMHHVKWQNEGAHERMETIQQMIQTILQDLNGNGMQIDYINQFIMGQLSGNETDRTQEQIDDVLQEVQIMSRRVTESGRQINDIQVQVQAVRQDSAAIVSHLPGNAEQILRAHQKIDNLLELIETIQQQDQNNWRNLTGAQSLIDEDIKELQMQNEKILKKLNGHDFCRSSDSGRVSCYSVETHSLNRPDAMAFCKARNGYLARLETVEEWEFLKGILRTTPTYAGEGWWHAGASAGYGRPWSWEGSTAGIGSFIWGDGQPNTHSHQCGYLNKRQEYKLYDYECHYATGFICEF